MRFGILFKLDTCILKIVFTLGKKEETYLHVILSCQIGIGELSLHLADSLTDWLWFQLRQWKMTKLINILISQCLCDQVDIR